MTTKQKIKIECIKKNMSIKKLSKELNMNSRQNMYHHIDKKNPQILKKIEEILSLPEGTLF